MARKPHQEEELPFVALMDTMTNVVGVLIIVLVVFGPKRLPELGKSMGKGIREFKGSLAADGDDAKRPELHASEATPVDGEIVTEHKA